VFVCTHVRSLHFRLDVILLAHHLPILTRQKKKIFMYRAGQVKGPTRRGLFYIFHRYRIWTRDRCWGHRESYIVIHCDIAECKKGSRHNRRVSSTIAPHNFACRLEWTFSPNARLFRFSIMLYKTSADIYIRSIVRIAEVIGAKKNVCYCIGTGGYSNSSV
jgi:hypothetical protein